MRRRFSNAGDILSLPGLQLMSWLVQNLGRARDNGNHHSVREGAPPCPPFPHQHQHQQHHQHRQHQHHHHTVNLWLERGRDGMLGGYRRGSLPTSAGGELTAVLGTPTLSGGGRDCVAEHTDCLAPNPTPASTCDPEPSLPYSGPQFLHLCDQ